MSSHESKRIVIAGGTGFLGRSLIAALPKAYDDVVVLTRGPKMAGHRIRHVTWDARTVSGGDGDWAGVLDGAAAVVNLVGRTVDCRKTAANKKVILGSRVDSVHALASAFARCDRPPPVWVQSATAHIYGDTADEVLDESSPFGTGFAPDVGRAWEAALAGADLGQCRRVALRISFVLGRDGGALATLARLARLGLGGTVGDGRQYLSWIHADDVANLIVRSIEDDRFQGPYVVTAPEPVTNRVFMAELRRAVGRPWSPPAPAALVRVGSWLMRTDPELALLGRRLVPTRLLYEGFVFGHPRLREAMSDLLTPAKRN